MDLRRLDSVPPDLDTLRAEAAREGFGALERLVADHASGVNTFSRPGEILLGGYLGDTLVAVGGLNHTPLPTCARLGRLRRLFVRPAHRRAGLGRGLVRALEAHAREAGMTHVSVHTTSPAAGRFYEALGYRRVDTLPRISHGRRLASEASPPDPWS